MQFFASQDGLVTTMPSTWSTTNAQIATFRSTSNDVANGGKWWLVPLMERERSVSENRDKENDMCDNEI